MLLVCLTTCPEFSLSSKGDADFSGPLTFRDSDAPQYIPAKITIVAVLSVCMVAVISLDLIYIRENRRRDRLAANLRPEDEIRDIEFMDLTDKQNPHFRVRLSQLPTFSPKTCGFANADHPVQYCL